MKLQYSRDSQNKDMQRKQSNFKRLKKIGRTARNLAFTIALPLLSLLSGCIIYKYDKPEECFKHNNTTTSINRETDGKVARITELEKYPEGSTVLTEEIIEGDIIITEELIDFINETHVLSTENMPSGVSITRALEYCFGSAYTAPINNDIFVLYPLNIASIGMAFHEIGHLQPEGDNNYEVFSELNELDQILAAFALFANQEYPEDNIRWAHYANCAYPSRFWFSIPNNMPEDISSFDNYDKADIFIHHKLIENNGDLAAVRAEAVELTQDGKLSSTLDEISLNFLEYYSSNPTAYAWADATLTIKIAAVKWLNMRFGSEMAQIYFDSNINSFLPSCGTPFFVFGLEGMNCTAVTVENRLPEIPTPEECTDLGGEIKHEVMARFCCFSMKLIGEDISFEKSVIDTNGYTCSGSLQIIDMEWDEAYFFNINSRTDLDVDEPCR